MAPKTEVAYKSASVEITRLVHNDLSPFTFSYHAMVSSLAEAENESMSPSPSMSTTWTLC